MNEGNKKAVVSSLIKDTLKAFDDFKNKQKSVWSNFFWYIKVVYSESVFNTLCIAIKHICEKKFPLDK